MTKTMLCSNGRLTRMLVAGFFKANNNKRKYTKAPTTEAIKASAAVYGKCGAADHKSVNLPKNPAIGGIPAKENKAKTIEIPRSGCFQARPSHALISSAFSPLD